MNTEVSQSPISGRKPSTSVRREQRTEKITAREEAIAVAESGYVLTRISRRIKKYTGCRNEYKSTDLYVIQHHCVLPYPARIETSESVCHSQIRQLNIIFMSVLTVCISQVL